MMMVKGVGEGGVGANPQNRVASSLPQPSPIQAGARCLELSARPAGSFRPQPHPLQRRQTDSAAVGGPTRHRTCPDGRVPGSTAPAGRRELQHAALCGDGAAHQRGAGCDDRPTRPSCNGPAHHHSSAQAGHQVSSVGAARCQLAGCGRANSAEHAAADAGAGRSADGCCRFSPGGGSTRCQQHSRGWGHDGQAVCSSKASCWQQQGCRLQEESGEYI